MTGRIKVTLLIVAFGAVFLAVGAFYGAGWYAGSKNQKTDCARQIAQNNADASNQNISADAVARRAVISHTTAEKVEWLKQNRAVR